MRCAHGATNVAHSGRKTLPGKTSALGDSTNVRWRAAAMAPHAAMTTSAAAITAPNVSSTFGVAPVECQSVHAINELVEGCMCRILVSRQLRHLLFLMLACVGGRCLCQVALIRQSRHLGCLRSVLVVIIVLSKDAECILFVWMGGGISVVACSGCRHVEAMLESLLE
jgi:hypothetical protein